MTGAIRVSKHLSGQEFSPHEEGIMRALKEGLLRSKGLDPAEFPDHFLNFTDATFTAKGLRGGEEVFDLLTLDRSSGEWRGYQSLLQAEEALAGGTIRQRYPISGEKGATGSKAKEPLNRGSGAQSLSRNIRDFSPAHTLSETPIPRNRKAVAYRLNFVEFASKKLKDKVDASIIRLENELRGVSRATEVTPRNQAIASTLQSDLKELKEIRRELDQLDGFALSLALKHYPVGDAFQADIERAQESLYQEAYPQLKSGILFKSISKQDESYLKDLMGLLATNRLDYSSYCRKAGIEEKKFSIHDLVMREAIRFSNAKLVEGHYLGGEAIESTLFSGLSDGAKRGLREDFALVGRMAEHAIPLAGGEAFISPAEGSPISCEEKMGQDYRIYHNSVRWNFQERDLPYRVTEAVRAIVPTRNSLRRHVARGTSLGTRAVTLAQTAPLFWSLLPTGVAAAIGEGVRYITPDALEGLAETAFNTLGAVPRSYLMGAVAASAAASWALSIGTDSVSRSDADRGRPIRIVDTETGEELTGEPSLWGRALPIASREPYSLGDLFWGILGAVNLFSPGQAAAVASS